MRTNINKYYNLGLITLLVFMLVSLITMPVVSATEYIDSNTIEQGTAADVGIVPYTRGSCSELVRAGLKSPRSCGYIQGRPKNGQIWLTPKQAICVRSFYEGAATNIISVPTGWGGGIVISYNLYKTFNLCKGV